MDKDRAMTRYITAIFVLLFAFSTCFADTFTHRSTGKTFNGYVVKRKRVNKTQVRIENKSHQYLNLDYYNIEPNYLGRKNKVFRFSITNYVNLICEVEAFEKAIVTAANQGPLFILIEIDTPGGRVDLLQRVCSAIINADNCTTVAFINNARFGGAYSQAAMVAMACDKVYMRTGTGIGAALSSSQTITDLEALERIYDSETAKKIQTLWRSYYSMIAERSNRPSLLIRAMMEKNLEVLEVTKDGKHYFINAKDKKPNQKVVRIWSKRGSLLALTADQALEGGIADKVVPSRNGLFIELAATKATQIPNKTILKARRDFERTRKDFDKSYARVNFLKEQSDALLEEIDELEERIRRLDPIYYRNRSVTWTGAPNQQLQSGYSNLQLERYTALTRRDMLLDQLIMALNYLVLNYKEAIPLAQNHKDLSHHINELMGGFETAVTTYRDINSRPRLHYNL